jgi:hypothetical protein
MELPQLPNFQQSGVCATRLHCESCRSLRSNGSFRANHAKTFSNIGDGIACEHGYPWGWKRDRAAPPAPEPTGPGDTVKAVLSKLGIHSKKGCGCAAMQAQMNAWGYRGCWQHRQEIEAWFRAKAEEAGIQLNAGLLWRWIATGEVK